MPRTRQLLALAAAALAALAAAAPAADARGFALGVGEPFVFEPQPEQRLLDELRGTRARFSRGAVFWRTMVPLGSTRPAGFDARDPGSRQYEWSRLDAFVRTTVANGMTPLLALYSAPDWAEGVDEGDRAQRFGDDGTYHPHPGEYGDFAHAVARRYSGSYPDPARPGQTLPRVRYFQAWNEPNFGQYLTMPRGRSAEASRHYVELLNALYAGVKAVHRSNFVVTAGTGPYGFNGHATDVEPQVFIRRMFCLERARRGLRRRRGCRVPRARFDALGHHPYTLAGTPTGRAAARDGGALGNMRDIKQILDYAVRRRLVAPRGRKQLWVTEFGWFSDPPGHALAKPLDVHARYTAESLWHLWRSGVDTVVWYALVDRPEWPGGLHFANRDPKPAATAFRFPCVAVESGRRLELWGFVPGARRVEVARRAGSRWRRVLVARTSRDGTFQRRLRRWRPGSYRARALDGARRGEVSEPFSARRR
jgi:hypothetical protein